MELLPNFVVWHRLPEAEEQRAGCSATSLPEDEPPGPAAWNQLGLPCVSAGKETACNVGDLDSISGLGRSPGEGKGYLLQYSGLENPMDCRVHGLAKSQT